MSTSLIHSKLDNIKITRATSVENSSQLEIECTAMISGEHSPCYCPISGNVLRDPDTNNLTLLEYTPELISAYASNFSIDDSPINFNEDHIDGSFTGRITNLSTKEIDGKLALIAKGIVEDKEWINKILQNQFSGISIETYSNLSDPSKSKLTAISLLNNLPPACPKEKCQTKILTASSIKEVIIVPDNSDLIFTEEEQEFLDNLGFDTKAAWDGPSSEKKLLDFSRDKDGKIVISKIRKYFLIVNGPSGENGQYTREDLKYPVGSIINGKPDYVLDGCIAALKRSAGEGIDLKQKIKRIIIRRFGVDLLPPSLKTKATLQLLLENDGDHMEILDGDDKIKINPLIPEVLKVEVITEASKEVPKINPPIPEVLKVEVTTEASKEVPKIETTIPEIPKVEVITEASKEVLKIETTIPEVPKVEVITEASKEIPKIETSITEILKPVLTKAQMDEVAVAMGTESFDVAVDMIKELADIKSRVDDKAGQWQVDDLQRQICSLKEENKELTAFKEATEEKELMDVLPKGIWTGEVEVDGVLVPKIKMIADEIRKGGVAVMLKYVKGAASGSIVNGKASEDVLENGKPKEIKTKGSSEASEIQDEGSDQKERVIKAVNDFTKKYMNGV